jgi:Tol biopolymer transport system component
MKRLASGASLKRVLPPLGAALLTALATLPPRAGGAQSPDQRPGEPELLAPGILSTGDDEAHATFAPDGSHVYFIKNAPNFAHWTIVLAERKGDGWGEPAVASFSGRYSDADLSFSPAGDEVYFVSTRPTSPGGPPRPDTEIWRMRGRAGRLGEPEHVAELSSDGNEWFPNATADGWLYFGSERHEGNLGAPGTSDLWRARLVDGRYEKPQNLGARLNTAGNDIEPWIAVDGRLLIFASNGRPDTRGSYDLYASRLCEEGWTEPRSLGGRVNSAGWDFGGRPTPDGRWLVFTSNRAYTDRPLERTLDYRGLLATIRSPGNGLRDIYRVEMASLDLGPECKAPQS